MPRLGRRPQLDVHNATPCSARQPYRRCVPPPTHLTVVVPKDDRPAAAALAAWYSVHGRALPWRTADPDPWHVLLSEFLLQQTRVETIVRRYAQIVAAIPTPAVCAALDDDALHRLWAGLGYYRRARNLRAAARAIVAMHGGAVPRNASALAALPGVGPYTTGAVAAIAFNMPVAGSDGNVARVYARVHGVRDLPEALKPPAAAWLQRLYAHGSPRDLLQAVMDLGATVCTPRAPRCSVCPLREACAARTWPDPTATPLRARPMAKPIETLTHAWISDGERVFLLRRPPGLLGERPAPPTVAGPPPDRWHDAHGSAECIAVGTAFRHVFTHRIWHVTPALYRWSQQQPPAFCADGAVIAAADIARAGLPRAFAKGASVLSAWSTAP